MKIKDNTIILENTREKNLMLCLCEDVIDTYPTNSAEYLMAEQIYNELK